MQPAQRGGDDEKYATRGHRMARRPVPISTMVTPTWSCWASTAPMTRPSPVKDDDADCDRMPARLDGDADTRGAEQDGQSGVAEAVARSGGGVRDEGPDVGVRVGSREEQRAVVLFGERRPAR